MSRTVAPRRGVLMTASSRKARPSWRDQEDEAEDVDDEDGERHGVEKRKAASNLEWVEIEREVREEKRRLFAASAFASGRRPDAAAAYDDVASEAEEEEAPRRPPQQQAGSDSEASAAVATPARPAAAVVAGPAGPGGEPPAAPEESSEAPLPPSGAVTAGQLERSHKRGGQKKTGAQRRREAGPAKGDLAEKGPRKKKAAKAEEEEDSKRWIKMRLEGETKAKRIDATRIVSYFDFDTAGGLSRREAPEAPEAPRQSGEGDGGVTAPASAPAPASTGNFRAQLRRDLFEDGEDSDER